MTALISASCVSRKQGTGRDGRERGRAVWDRTEDLPPFAAATSGALADHDHGARRVADHAARDARDDRTVGVAADRDRLGIVLARDGDDRLLDGEVRLVGGHARLGLQASLARKLGAVLGRAPRRLVEPLLDLERRADVDRRRRRPMLDAGSVTASNASPGLYTTRTSAGLPASSAAPSRRASSDAGVAS
jgi:hypothetical protein